jgi:uncharacterized tellurite resistance protein B-like protein
VAEMIELIKSLFVSDEEKETNEVEEMISIATLTLLLEIAHSDRNFTKEEESRIDKLVKTYFHLNDNDFESLKRKVETNRKEHVDLYDVTKAIRQNYSIEKRIEVMEMFWKVVYADGTINKYEESLCRQLAELMGLQHKHYIESKLKISRFKSSST